MAGRLLRNPASAGRNVSGAPGLHGRYPHAALQQDRPSRDPPCGAPRQIEIRRSHRNRCVDPNGLLVNEPSIDLPPAHISLCPLGTTPQFEMTASNFEFWTVQGGAAYEFKKGYSILGGFMWSQEVNERIKN